MRSLRKSGVFTLWMKILGRMDFLGGKGCSFNKSDPPEAMEI
jgi:hypothetical protein